MTRKYLVLSALGKDRPGLIDQLTRTLLEDGCNIEDSRMSVLGGEFALILLISGPSEAIDRVAPSLPDLQQRLGLLFSAQPAEGRQTPGNTIPYAVDVVSIDHPGIVHRLANFFSSRDINIEDMTTHSYAAPHTGTPMFSVEMTIGVPAEQSIHQLREAFLEFSDAENLDTSLEPLKA